MTARSSSFFWRSSASCTLGQTARSLSAISSVTSSGATAWHFSVKLSQKTESLWEVAAGLRGTFKGRQRIKVPAENGILMRKMLCPGTSGTFTGPRLPGDNHGGAGNLGLGGSSGGYPLNVPEVPVWGISA